jgi:methionyl aminopeptidase
MNKQELEAYQKAGEIAKKVKEYAKKQIKQGKPLAEIAEQIEAKIKDLGGEPAFPVNLSIDDIAAHYTPTLSDEKIAEGLLKVDIGVHINGFIADTAFTLDLTKKQEHKPLIQAAEAALEAAEKITTAKTSFGTIGSSIHKEITDLGFSPIRNLSGHSLGQFQVHAGETIPNYDNNNENPIGEGAFAIEPFATSGEGLIYEGADSNIYHLIKEGNVRDSNAREILAWIQENKETLPFSERELEREFKRSVKISLKRLIEAGLIESYPQLIEKSHAPVAQAENTIIISKDKVEVITD